MKPEKNSNFLKFLKKRFLYNKWEAMYMFILNINWSGIITQKWGFLRCFVRSFHPHLDVWSCPHDCVLNIVFPTFANFNLNSSKYINILLPSTFKSSTNEKSLKHAYPKPKKITQAPWPSCSPIPQNDPK